MANVVAVGVGAMPQANNYQVLLGQARATSIIAEYTNQGKTTVDPVLGCILITSALRPDGYAHTKRWTNVDLQLRAAGHRLARNSGTNFLLHRVAYLARTGVDIVGVSSHLCPYRNCLLHVVDETQAENVSRNHCPGNIVCPDHDVVVYDFCQHNPRCLRVQLYGSCCLREDSSATESVESVASLSRVIPDSQETEGALSDFLSMLGDPELLPGSQYLALAGQEEENSADEVDSEQEPSEMDTSMMNLSLNADEENEPSSSPPRLPTRRRVRPQPVLESSSSQLPSQSPSLPQTDDFIVGDDVIFFDTSVGLDDDSDF